MLLLLLSCTEKHGDFRDLTPTPPMGWNSWDAYGITVNEQEVRAVADYMAEHLLRYGWEYVVIDGAWNSPLNDSIPRIRDEYGRNYPAVNRFPSSADFRGFKPLADYVHAKGLKFGLHNMRGIPRWMVAEKVPIKGAPGITADMIASERNLCQWSDGHLTVEASRPGAQEYYNSLFELYAEWGVDFVKYDDLSAPYYHDDEVELIRNAIEACGRPMVLSTSPGETPVEAAEHLRAHANMWRTVNDVWDHWFQIEHIMEVHERWYPYIGDGCWPDCDMLPLGKLNVRGSNNPPRQTRLTRDEQLSAFSFFSIVRSPLIFGGDILSMDPFTLAMLTNADIIAMNQQGSAPRQLRRDKQELVVVSDAPGGGVYTALFNLSEQARTLTLRLSDLGLDGKCQARDLWEGGRYSCSGILAAEAVPPHGCRVFRIQAGSSDEPVYPDPSSPLEERVEDALSRMSLEEKVAMTHAQSKFSSAGVPRLGIPEVWHSDGPHGIRSEVLWDDWDQAGWTNDSCTAFPALVGLAATWDRELARLYGESIGAEARYRKKDILLGPGINMGRTPLNGRTFEYMGEDPYLAGEMVVPYVQGVQSNGVAACVKHFALNNQEVRRTATSSNVDDRTLYEIYLPAFKKAVQEGGAWAIMGSYNLYNNQFNCHNKRLLCDILKGEWGFDGIVVSDWGGCRDDEEAITNGLDIEMGTWTDGLRGGASDAYSRYHLANPYLERLRDGRAGKEELDDKVRRILRTVFRTSMGAERHYGSFASPEHFAAARKMAADGIVLLRNDGILPLCPAPGSRILVVGENAVKKMCVGGGSSNLKTQHEIIPLDALQAAFSQADVSWERGYVGDVSTSYNLVSTGQDLSEKRSAEQLRADALAAAREADYVLFIGGLNKSGGQDNEGTDRADIVLPYGQDALIEALAAVSRKLVVVNISGSPVAMPWAEKANAIVQAWYGGSEAGHALADVLSGTVNPSGKLPFTMPLALSDGPLKTERQYPGIREEGQEWWQEYYDEGIFIGYRWYDTQGIPVQYPFGFGLSYTRFALSDASIRPSGKGWTVTATLTNTGDVAGAEVVQLYLSDPEASVPRPAKELKGFQKVFLQPGESRELQFLIGREDLSWFDADAHAWVVEPGAFNALLASSSADILATLPFHLNP